MSRTWIIAAAAACAVVGLSCNGDYTGVYVTGTASLERRADATFRVEGELKMDVFADGHGNSFALDEVVITLISGGNTSLVTLEKLEVDPSGWPVEVQPNGSATRTVRFVGAGALTLDACSQSTPQVGVSTSLIARDPTDTGEVVNGQSVLELTLSGPTPSARSDFEALGIPTDWAVEVGAATPLVDLAVDPSGVVWVVGRRPLGGHQLMRVSPEGAALDSIFALENVRIATGDEPGVILAGTGISEMGAGGAGASGSGASGSGASGSGASGSGGMTTGAGGSGGAAGTGGAGGSGGAGGTGGAGGSSSALDQLEVTRVANGIAAWHHTFEGQSSSYGTFVSGAGGRVLVAVSGHHGLIMDGQLLDASAEARYLVVLDELTGAVSTFETIAGDVTAVASTPDGAFALSLLDPSSHQQTLSVVEPDLAPRWMIVSSQANTTNGYSRLTTGGDGSIFWFTDRLRKATLDGQTAWDHVVSLSPQSLAWTPDGGIVLAGSTEIAWLDSNGNERANASLNPCGFAGKNVFVATAGPKPGFFTNDGNQEGAGRLAP